MKYFVSCAVCAALLLPAWLFPLGAREAGADNCDHRAAIAERARLIALFNARGSEAVPELTAALDRAPPFIPRTAAHLLARIGAPALPGLEIGLQHPDFQVRRIVIESLADMGVLPDYWHVILMDDHPMIRRDMQVWYLDRYPMPAGPALDKLVDAMARSYDTAPPARRLHIVEIVSALQPLTDNARDMLLRAFADEDAAVRIAAANGLMDDRPALLFDGERSFVEAEGAVEVGAGNFTCEIWFKPRDSSGNQVLMGSGRGDNVRRPGVNLRYNHQYRTVGFLAANEKDGLGLSSRIAGAGTADRWFHVAVSVDRGGLALMYVDGLQVGQADARGFGAAPGFDAGPFIVGRRPVSDLWHYHGEIGEVRLWRGARTPEDIRANMVRRLTGKEPDLLLYWPMDEGGGTIVRDLGPHGHHGAVKDAAWRVAAPE